MKPFVDLHTHRAGCDDGSLAVFNLLLNQSVTPPPGLFTAGLHPWYVSEFQVDTLFKTLASLSANMHMIAIGETGLDKVCPTPMDLQLEVFRIHLEAAEKYSLPVIIHCVKAWEELINLVSIYQVRCILHGYNGSAELTRQLLKDGFLFSVGNILRNPNARIRESVRLIPLDCLFCETDDSGADIRSVYQELASIKQVSLEQLCTCIYDNFCELTSRLSPDN